MEKYENLGMIGEGSYGMVMKCRHKETKQLVAIKKFIETEDDKTVKKIALREVRMLKQVRHENLINLIEVFRRKKRLYLVFEFMDHTALDDLERFPTGADEVFVKKIMFQVVRGVEFCHHHNILHRDVKPENILISKRGVVKLCDFGFARTIAPPGEVYTDYVATRWYRAPELLVGDTSYGKEVDIWAIGCLFSEMLTGEPLFPGESDIDQIYLVTKCFGHMTAKHREIFSRNPLFLGMRLPEARELEPLERRYPRLSPAATDIIKWSLRLDPIDRPTCSQLLRHELFTKSGWAEHYLVKLQETVEKELEENPLLKSLGISFHGKVHESKSKPKAEPLPAGHAQMPPSKKAAGASDMGMHTSGAEGMSSDAEAIKKEKKKKKVKKEHGAHKDKLQPTHADKTKHSKQLSPIHRMAPSNSLLVDPILNSSRISLTGSVSRLAPLSPRPLVSPRLPLSPRQTLSPRGPMNGHVHDMMVTSLKPTTPAMAPPSSLLRPLSNSRPVPQLTVSHLSPPSQAPPPLPHSHASFMNNFSSQNAGALKTGQPPIKGSMTPIGLDGYSHKLYPGPDDSPGTTHHYYGGNPLRSTQPSDTDLSLISERSTRMKPPRLSPLHKDPVAVTSTTISTGNLQSYFMSPHGSPRSSARVAKGINGMGGVSYKKQFSKSKDVVLPHLKDTDSQIMKFSQQKVGVAGGGALSLASGSQSNGFGMNLGMGGVTGVGTMGNKGRVLGPLGSHMNSLDGYRTTPAGLLSPPSPPSHAHQNVLR